MRTHGSAAELEVKRRIAGRLLLDGKTVTEVARLVGASWTAVKRWKVAIEKQGLEGLAAKPHPGARPRLTQAQKRQLVKILLRGPQKAGFPTDLWTCPRVAAVIQTRFQVTYHVDYVWQILHNLGWSCQKPEHRARERNETAIAQWRAEQWPRIKKSASPRKTDRFPG